MSVSTLVAPIPTQVVAAPSAPTNRVRVVAPDFRISDSSAAAVLRAAVQHGPIARDAAARITGASIATVNRQVAALLGSGLLRERADLTEPGAIGRPRVPFEVDHDSYLTVGIHVGAVVTSVIAADLRGRILGGVEIPTPSGPAERSVAAIAYSARKFAARWHRRRPLWTGVALGGRVDPETGIVDHERLGWHEVPVGAIVADVLGLPTSVAAHVEAMAAAELLLAQRNPSDTPRGGTSLYVYARETAGVAISLDDRVHTPNNGPGSIAHLPTVSDVDCECGQRGCLEAAVSDRAVLTRAVQLGLIDPAGSRPVMGELYRAARDGSLPAHELLVERARILGRAVATLRDVLNPDRVILGGQAFTEYPAAVPHVAEAFASRSTLTRKDIRITGFGNRVQEFAGAVTSLSAIYADPIPAVRRSAGVRAGA
ncbi:ROK family protein [Aldersonia sp. NBC_00410]|uniref:ROK family transcriptional regulator n=1 Tax=Aldersonia sp. NBC_00410 TaxID=2975954 RepID=UPI00224EDD97|nr:ROK family protein [Aldersonia sp. NBC_00410]MCX5041803.1 ROK family protein [Aldersonia sp. NBC_00410]